jgi:CRP-like cAMP-binding protein/signal transduction histidine kinase
MNDPTILSKPTDELQSRISLLQEISFFKGLNASQLAVIAQHLQAKTVTPGHRVLNQDQPVDGVYFLQAGEVQILVSNEQTGQEELITNGCQGECFGEMSTLRGDIPASATVVSADECRFLYIARDDFVRYVNQFNLWPLFVNILASRLEQTNHRMTEVMKHLKQGMVQVDTKGLITGKFSMGFVRLIGGEINKLHGESFPGLVFADCQDANRKWTDNFSLAIMSIPEQAELILNLLPAECRFNHPEKGQRIFSISYDLCIYQKQVIGMDIGLEDVTRVRELARKSEELEKEKSIVGEIYTKPETFRTLLGLINEIEVNLGIAETDMATGKIKKEDARIWLGNLHSLKGTSHFLKLTELGQAAHRLENLFSQNLDSEKVEEKSLLELKAGKQELIDQIDYVNTLLVNMGEETRKRMTADLVMSKAETEALENVLEKDGRAYRMLQKARKIPSQKLVEGWKDELERISQRLSKKIIFRVIGESIPIPGTVFNALKIPLVHLLRNCAEHGIESIADRKRGGKPSIGLITFQAELAEDCYYLHIQDNGRGISKDLVYSKALQVAKHNETLRPRIKALLNENRPLAILFLPGFSTSEKITELSGRGVGLDVVQRAASEVEGTISMKSIPGKGTKFTLTFPR